VVGRVAGFCYSSGLGRCGEYGWQMEAVKLAVIRHRGRAGYGLDGGLRRRRVSGLLGVQAAQSCR
jgi:hypothetical protein